MKLTYFLLIIITTIAFIACNSDTNPAENGGDSDKVTKDYYPGGTGSSWTYTVGLSDSGSTTMTNTGTKVNTFTNVTSGSGYDNIQLDEALVVNGNTVPTRSVDLRRTDTGLFIVIDTTGLQAELPDTLVQELEAALGAQIVINIDTEVQTLSVPLFSGQSWKAFAFNISAGFLNIDVISVNGSYEGSENINIGTETYNTEKIKYSITFKVPTGGVSFSTKEYEAFAWYAEGIGLVKFQGNGLLTNVLSGSEIDLSDTNRVAIQELTTYEIK